MLRCCMCRDDASSAHLVQFRLATTYRLQELTYEAESSGLFGISTGRPRCDGGVEAGIPEYTREADVLPSEEI